MHRVGGNRECRVVGSENAHPDPSNILVRERDRERRGREVRMEEGRGRGRQRDREGTRIQVRDHVPFG